MLKKIRVFACQRRSVTATTTTATTTTETAATKMTTTTTRDFETSFEDLLCKLNNDMTNFITNQQVGLNLDYQLVCRVFV